MDLRKYGVSTTVYFPLIDFGATDFESTPVTFASGDTKIIKDGGASANATNDPAHEGNGIYSLVLTATEMQAAEVVVTVIDQTATKEWEDQAIIISTYGNASAQHAFDLDTAEQDVDAVKISGSTAAADSVEANIGNLDQAISSLNDPTTAAIADAVLDELLSGHTTAGSLGKAVSDILADTGTDGVAIATATMQAIADEVLKRGMSNVEDTADALSLCAIVLATFESSISTTTWTIRKSGGSTFDTRTVTLDAGADPISGVT